MQLYGEWGVCKEIGWGLPRWLSGRVCLHSMQETQVSFLGREDPLGEEIATHSSMLAWKTPWTEESGGPQAMESQRVGHNWAYMWRRKWQPTPVFLPGESHGQRSLMDCCLWGCKQSDMTEVTQHACVHRRRKWQPTPVFLPGESQGQRSLVGCHLWGRRVGHAAEHTWPHTRRQDRTGSISYLLPWQPCH